eukprot:CAMPEP_0116846274 /NCGR_PEP_ID=MMETSP0418-20121206/13741_1 /TAXON_ID=1158023 /ORGANISM="Astrosyne radiata, Strain 13vi08-1A" /LENGTH=287 /DNA_ID=CAMNT_0004477497 /DNA_START=152 /DNA_END=1015 /DNA_ORIENTATION=-
MCASPTNNPFASSPVSVAQSNFDLPQFPGLVNESTISLDLPSSKIDLEDNVNKKRPSDAIASSESDQDSSEASSTNDDTAASSSKKRKRSKRSATTNKFRPYQAEKWKERFDELIDFRKSNGHCLVPHTFPSNPPLARWVKRQRYQYKLLTEGKQSSMTNDRIRALEEVGFIWDSHEAAWEDRLRELLEYKTKNGNCLVPSNYPENPQLATWVKCQRRQYKLYWEGRPSNMTVERIMELEQNGFEWELRSSTYTKKLEKNNQGKDDDMKMFMDLISDLSEDDPVLSL